MARRAEPVSLLVAKGKSHLTKSEIRERTEREIKVPFTDVSPPDYLNARQKDRFNRYAKMLLALNVMTELDEESLAHCVLEEELNLAFLSDLTKARNSGDQDAVRLAEIMYDKSSKRLRLYAADNGLTITSRGRLSAPPPPEDDDEL